MCWRNFPKRVSCASAVRTRLWTGLPWRGFMKIKCFLWVSLPREGQLCIVFPIWPLIFVLYEFDPHCEHSVSAIVQIYELHLQIMVSQSCKRCLWSFVRLSWVMCCLPNHTIWQCGVSLKWEEKKKKKLRNLFLRIMSDLASLPPLSFCISKLHISHFNQVSDQMCSNYCCSCNQIHSDC